MVKISDADLTNKIPQAAKSPAQDAAPAWLGELNKTIQGIKDLADFYRELKGEQKPPVPTMESYQDKPSFHEARAAKKAETASKNESVKELKMPESELLKELVGGLLKTCMTMQKLGYGDSKLGDVILQAPFTVNQTTDFLAALWNKHFGG